MTDADLLALAITLDGESRADLVALKLVGEDRVGAQLLAIAATKAGIAYQLRRRVVTRRTLAEQGRSMAA